VGTIGEPRYYTDARISPDGKQLAVTIGRFEVSDVWVTELTGGILRKVTFNEPSLFPVWSPDSRTLVFSRAGSSDGFRLMRKHVRGTGDEEPLLISGAQPSPSSISPDGRFLLYEVQGEPAPRRDVMALALDGGGKSFPVINTPADESNGVLSPDGRWVAYISDAEIYVQSFPKSTGGTPVARGALANRNPMWRNDSKELFYLAAAQSSTTGPSLMAVALQVDANGELSGEPRELFRLPRFSTFITAMPDGSRFLTAVTEAEGATPFDAAPFTVVLNWTAALRR
jgi:Tol biopolymer transport system component